MDEPAPHDEPCRIHLINALVESESMLIGAFHRPAIPTFGVKERRSPNCEARRVVRGRSHFHEVAENRVEKRPQIRRTLQLHANSGNCTKNIAAPWLSIVDKHISYSFAATVANQSG